MQQQVSAPGSVPDNGQRRLAMGLAAPDRFETPGMETRPMPESRPASPSGPWPAFRRCILGVLGRALWFTYLAALFALALGPVAVNLGFQHGDKVLHCGAFGVLSLAWPWRLRWERLWIPASLAVALPALVEIGQEFAPAYGRCPDMADFLAGLAGYLLGLGLRLLWLYRLETRRGAPERP